MADNISVKRPKELQESIDSTKASYYRNIEKAPAKRGWNSTFNVPIDGLNELTRAYNMKMRTFNAICINEGYPQILNEETVVDPVA